MKTFNVEMTFTCYKTFEIEAASEEAARDAAREMFDAGQIKKSMYNDFKDILSAYNINLLKFIHDFVDCRHFYIKISF
jgi:hypothetical protein